MTSPRPLRSGPSSTRRLMLWSISALLVIAGVVLYFRFGAQPVPLIDQTR